jgi:hypothetical protein
MGPSAARPMMRWGGGPVKRGIIGRHAWGRADGATLVAPVLPALHVGGGVHRGPAGGRARVDAAAQAAGDRGRARPARDIVRVLAGLADAQPGTSSTSSGARRPLRPELGLPGAARSSARSTRGCCECRRSSWHRHGRPLAFSPSPGRTARPTSTCVARIGTAGGHPHQGRSRHHLRPGLAHFVVGAAVPINWTSRSWPT